MNLMLWGRRSAGRMVGCAAVTRRTYKCKLYAEGLTCDTFALGRTWHERDGHAEEGGTSRMEACNVIIAEAECPISFMVSSEGRSGAA